MSIHFIHSNGKQPGAALVIVLWFIVLLTVMAGSFTLTMHRETGLIRNAKQQAISGALADGGLYYAMMMLLQSDPELKWKADGTIYEFPLGSGKVRVQIYDEAGKFDLNNTDAPVLRSVFSSVGLNDEDAESLADAVLDWRDEDDLTHLKGAEEDDYQNAGRNYGPGNSAFKSIEEFGLVFGVNYEIYRAIKPLITIYSGQAGIDRRVASRDALLALPDIDISEVEACVLSRSDPLPNSVSVCGFQGIQGVSAGGTKDKFYSIKAEARIMDDTPTAVSAIVTKKTTASGVPFTILQWSRSPVGQNSLFSRDLSNLDAEKNN